MKNLVSILVALVFTTTPSFAQPVHIDSFTVIPAQPTYADTLTVLAHCYFPSSGCPLKSSAVNQQSLLATATHCLGMATTICMRTDTFKLLPRPAGTYQFRLSVYTGGIPNCDTSIFGGEDSTSFTVTGSPSSVNHGAVVAAAFRASYSPGQLQIFALPSGLANYNIQIVSTSGQKVLNKYNCRGDQRIPIELSPGLYIITVSGENQQITSKLVIN